MSSINLEDIEIDILRLTPFEKLFYEEDGHWDKDRLEKINIQIKYVKNREKSKKYFDKMFPISENAVLSLEYKLIINGWEDVFNIFSKQELKENFIKFLFNRVIEENIYGSTPFYFNDNSNSYVLDYRFIVESFLMWGIEFLKFDSVKFASICRWFIPNLKGNNQYACHSFVELFLNFNRRMLATSFKEKYFFNAAIVSNSMNNKEMFYMGIPFSHVNLLYMLERDMCLKLIKKRQINNLSQTAFGTEAFSRVNVEQFYLLNF